MRAGILAAAALFACAAAAQDSHPGSRAAGIASSLTGSPGDPVRGRAIVANRQVGLCLLCHSGPIPEERFQGDLAPSLAGAGKRLTSAGTVLWESTVKIVRPDGSVCAPGELGEILCSSNRLMTEYWNRPAATAEAQCCPRPSGTARGWNTSARPAPSITPGKKGFCTRNSCFRLMPRDGRGC